MKDFKGKLAFVTGGGTSMGRELVLQLAAAGCHVGTCYVSEENMRETKQLCTQASPSVHAPTHLFDVAKRNPSPRVLGCRAEPARPR
jgi:NAD(P)-dependent dehydrogenase (short-subunit alcohol dehydrogenase family)